MMPSVRSAAVCAVLLSTFALQAQPVAAPSAATAAPVASAPPGVVQDPEKENIGRVTAQAWLIVLDRRDWGVAWDNASNLFRKNVPLANWMDAIPKVREPFGVLVERRPVQTVYKTTLPGHPPGEYVTVIFESKFDRKADVVETVTSMRELDGRWRVTGYSAR